MEAHTQSRMPALVGLVLIIVGFVVFVGSYFLLPLFVTTLFSCFDVCGPAISRTAWEDSLYLLANFEFFPIANTLVLALYHLPLLAAVVGVGYSLAYRVRPSLSLAIWSRRIWIVGTIALIVMLLLLLIGARPDWGYLGMLLGYGMCWVGSRLLAGYPEPQAV